MEPSTNMKMPFPVFGIALRITIVIAYCFLIYIFFKSNETFLGVTTLITTIIFGIWQTNLAIKYFNGTLWRELKQEETDQAQRVIQQLQLQSQQNPLPPDQTQQQACLTIAQQKKELDLREEQLQLDKKKLQLEQEIQNMQQTQQPNQQPTPPEPPKQQPPPKTDTWEDPWPDPDKE